MQYFKILFVFPEHQKHQRHFHSKITLADITIKYILSFAEQYQRYCFSLKLTFGNNTTQYDVLYVFKKYFDINSFSYKCKKLKATKLYANCIALEKCKILNIILGISSQKYLWLTLPSSTYKVLLRISNILFLLDTNLWQQYQIMLSFKFF